MKMSIGDGRGMRSKFGFQRVVLGSVLALFSITCIGFGQDDVPSSSVQFMVVRDEGGKPVRNAAVVLHPVNSKGKQARSGMELKTNSEGKTSFDGVPYGTVRVQVLAPGFQTYGEDFDINKPTFDIVVKLKRPQGQYSVYDDPNKKPDDKKPEDKKPDQK